MPSRSRDRQLAKLAARRQAEKERQRRRRNMVLGVGGVVVALILVAVGFKLLTGSNTTSAASTITPSATPTPSSSPQASPCGKPTPPKGAGEKKPTFDKAPPMTIDPSKTYTATFKTTCGTFVAQLLPKEAPQAVNSFVFLADQGFYDGLTFHRIVKDFVIQGGDPKGDGTGGPGYETPVTVSKGQTFNAAGVLAFAHTQTGGNGSQFFVTLAATPNLNPTPQSRYTIFGNVTKGLDVVKKIGSVPTVTGPTCPAGEACSPTEPIFIVTLTVSES
jgi:cyclophilin family peptidyl-prolyl cis-trans isomerase